jgi:hypothetical protein
MSKTLKQHALQRTHHKRGTNVSGKFTGLENYAQLTAPVNPRIKGLLSKVRQSPPTQYIVVKVNQEMAKLSEQRVPTAKAVAAKALFAKYRASK